MGLCMKANCTVNNLCRQCRRLYPATALQNDRTRRERREGNRGKTAYGRGSTSGAYGRSSYSMRSGEFDGLPSLSRKRGDGAIEIFYQDGNVDMDDPEHGHAVIKDGKLVYKRRPGESTPIVDND